MARVRHTRTVTADDGTQVKTTIITKSGDIVADDRNRVVTFDADGNILSDIPMSVQVARNNADWYSRIADAA